MVRPANVGRSRACVQCKKKRIKCDLQAPACQRCIESNIICSGPVSGLLIVNQDSASYPRGRSGGQQRSNHTSRTPNAFTLTPSDELVPTSTYDDILLSRFLNYFSQNAGGRTWTAKLPFLTHAKNAAAMKTAARAVSLAFAAQNMQNTAMAQAACEYYGNSLRYHQASFKAPPGKNICKKKAVNALPVTVLLSYFEMIQATSADAWLKHTVAAERLFVLLGPNALDDDLLNHLYFIIRSNSAIRCFLLGSKTQLLEQSWSEVPMVRPCGRTTAVFNSLVDLIMWISSSIHIHGPSNHSSQMSYNLLTLERTLGELKRLWVVFGESLGLDTSENPLLVHEQETLSTSVLSADDPGIPIIPLALQEPSSALTCAFFHAAAVLLLTLVRRKHLSPSLSQIMYSNQYTPRQEATPFKDENYRGAIRHHSSAILALTGYLRTQKVGCACLRMILPLATVNRFSPRAEQRLEAETVFRDWSTGDGLPGLASFAFNESSYDELELNPVIDVSWKYSYHHVLTSVKGP